LSANSNGEHEAKIRGTRGPGLLPALAAAVLFSTGGAAIKTAAFSGMQIASIRSGIAALTLLLWVRGRLTWSWPTLAIGAAHAVTLILFVSATKLTTAANAIFLQATAPLYLAILAPLLLGERFRRCDLLFLAAVVAGLAMCFAGRAEPTLTAPDPFTGNLLGAASGITWALTLIAFRWGERHGPRVPLSGVVAGNALAFGIGLPFLFPVPPATAAEWATMAYLGIFQIALAYVFLTRAVASVPALDLSLILLLEPVLNPIWTWVVRGEEPGGWTILGGALIVAAMAAKATLEER
jgi:drug/metabolite transporter (DMT)-like permease